ncbi:MAG: hypothetical protein QM495_12825, partial [Lutibacter sp.]|uniref:hypothetical protein n=1 Tax=Lutibacter sp. TaxID=1925666 RepID=UPI00385A0CEB
IPIGITIAATEVRTVMYSVIPPVMAPVKAVVCSGEMTSALAATVKIDAPRENKPIFFIIKPLKFDLHLEESGA